ncbi:MAG: hypothetical protein IPH42_20910 [Bacteroidetes bacterium]|nr:hypothetical protein [Bacteroidota bacterium]
MNINSAHWHLLLNHFPIILSVIGTGFIVASFIFKKQHLKFASLLLIILAAAFTIPAFATGEPAEEQVEEISSYHEAIHEHEEIAEKGRIVIFITGGLAFITLLLLHFKKKSVQMFMILTLLASAGSAGIFKLCGLYRRRNKT